MSRNSQITAWPQQYIKLLEIFQTGQTEGINRIFKKTIHSRKTLVKKQYKQKEYYKDVKKKKLDRNTPSADEKD